MMDVERLKKLNTLAGQLKGQGIAGNYEDAAYLATAIHGREPEACLAGMSMSESSNPMAKEIMDQYNTPEMPQEQAAPQVSPQQTLEAAAPSAPVVQGLSKDEVEVILQNFANQVAKEFTALQQRVVQAEATVRELRQEVYSSPKQTTIPESPAAPTQTAGGPTPQKTVTPEVKSEYTSNDVSVEKIFYYGNK